MNHTMNADESGPSTKRKKSNDEEKSHHQVLSTNLEASPDILKLNIDCFEELSDYLSLTDVLRVGNTCKRLRKVAGHCFRRNYKANEVHCDSGNFFMDRINVNSFIGFIEKVMVDDAYFHDDLDDSERDDDNDEDTENDETFKLNCVATHPPCINQFQSLKQLQLYNVVLTEENIEIIKQILGIVHHLKVYNCEIDGSFFESVLVHCKNMKRLCVDEWTISQIEDDWLQQSYPTLTDFELFVHRHGEIQGLKTFFELNPNVRTFSIGSNSLWLNRNVIAKTQFALDILAVDYDQEVELDGFCQFLNELYERGVYEKLHFYFGYSDLHQEIINQLTPLKALAKLRAKTDTKHINLSTFRNLEELCVSQSSLVTDLKSLPNILTNLKHIHFAKASSDDILPFISSARNLRKIKVLSLLTGTHFDQHEGIINLNALNEERKKLATARKVTIYVDEKVYLATKWANKQTDFGLIEMLRADSHEWNHEFECDNHRYDK